MYTKQQLKEEAYHELRMLDKLLDVDERSFIDEEFINPFKRSSCIYGQITGNCFNERAVELINKCAVRLISSRAAMLLEFADFDEFAEEIEKNTTIMAREKGDTSWLSPLEVYIMFNSWSNVVKFLKGDKEALND